MAFTPIILAHVVTAAGALVIGGLTLTMKKGTFLHKTLGRVWVGLMILTALVSFGIRIDGHFSWIHILSVVTLVGVTSAVIAAMRGNIRAHRGGMLASYISLAVAGAFTLLPDRLLGDLVWSTVLA